MSHPEAALRCAHCGEPLAGSAGGAGPHFCCHGCRLAWELLHDEGLEAYYDLRERLGGVGRPVRSSGRSYAEFRDPVFLDRWAPRDLRTGTRRVRLLLTGLHCAACVWVVERSLQRRAGVVEAELELERGLLSLRWDPEMVDLAELAAFLDRLGYEVRLYTDAAYEASRREERRRLWLRLGIAGALAGNLMLLGIPLYTELWRDVDPLFLGFFRWAQAVLAIPIVLYAAAPFHRNAWRSLRMGILHIDLPISLAVWLAFVGSLYATFTGAGATYFESLGGLVFLLLIGRAVLTVGRDRAEAAARALLALGEATARRLRPDGSVEEVAWERIVPGDRLIVPTGATFVVDGRVVEGTGFVDAAILTGEAEPVPVEPGSSVVAGARNVGAPLVVAAEAVGADRRIARIAALAREAGRRRAPIAGLADRLAGVFTAATLVLTAGTLLWWWWRSGSLESAVGHAVAVAVVACPCALGLATPLALAVGRGRAAGLGVILRGDDALERLARVRRVCLDKTGTLTEGQPRIVAWLGARTWEGASLPTLVAALERYATHPLARAFLAAAEGPLPSASEVVEEPGNGIHGRVAGVRLRVGRPGWVEGAPSDAWLRPPQAVPGATPVWIAVDDRLVAVTWIADPLRPGAAEAIARLRRHGYELELLSGDRPGLVAAVAESLAIPLWQGGLTPEEKLMAIRRRRDEGPVAMVGDGVNDTAALAAADVGLAIGGGAEAALAAADGFLAEGGIEQLAALAAIAQGTLRTIRRNVLWSLVYNVVGVTAAVAGWIGPLAAAVLMPVSSLTVLLSSLVGGRGKEGRR